MCKCLILIMIFVGLAIVAGDYNILGAPNINLAVFGIMRSPADYVDLPPASSSSNFQGVMFAIIMVNLDLIVVGTQMSRSNTFNKNKIDVNHAHFGQEPLIVILPADQVCSI